MDAQATLDRELEAAQAALLARYAPETPARRVRWSHGETQVLEPHNPNLRVVRIPDAGHLPWLDAPERVVAELERSWHRAQAARRPVLEL